MAYTPTGVDRDVTDGAAYDAFPNAAYVAGHIVAVWRRSAVHGFDSSAQVLAARSTDGVTWSDPVVVADTAEDDHTAGLTVLPDGTLAALLVSRTSGGTYTDTIYTSPDGVAWTPGSVVSWASGGQPFGSCVTWVADGSATGLLLACAYLTASDPPAVVSASTDSGVTWTPRGGIPAAAGESWQEPQIVQLADGSLLMTLRVDAGSTPGIYTCTSADYGVTWTTPVLAIPGGSGLPAVRLAQGVLLLLYRAGDTAGWATSTDAATWTAQEPFASAGLRLLYGDWAVLPGGAVVCVYGRELNTGSGSIHAQRLTLDTTAPAVAVSAPQVTTRVQWLGCDLATGRVIANLPDLDGEVSRVLGRYTSSALSLPIPTGGHGSIPLELVEAATAPARTMLVCVLHDAPVWAGIPLPRRGGTAATLHLPCVSVDGYLLHRFVRDHTWVQQDESSVIAAGLLGDAGDIAGVGPGINMIVDAAPTGRLRDRTYAAADHKTVYEALAELMAVQDGPEWTLNPAWSDATHTIVRVVAQVRSRIGAAGTPSAVFSSTGESDASYEYTEDLSGDRYANYVVAYSFGDAATPLSSSPAVDTAALAAGAPIWERHFQPSTSITSTAVLDEHAAEDLTRVRDGALIWDITSRWDRHPRYGIDWLLGDEVAWQLKGHRHPGGVSGTGRVAGFVLNPRMGTMRPILREE